MQQPNIRFDHLIKMTDDTGILEHGLGSLPRRKEGYSTDDQARALWVCLEWLGRCGEQTDKQLLSLAEKYLAFLLWAQEEDGRFYNNFAYDRSREPEQPSDDCLGRCLWACALAMTRRPSVSISLAAENIFFKALGQVWNQRYPRGWAYSLAAIGLLKRAGLADEKMIGLAGTPAV
ncbi:hypothetical protein [Paenibacillus physcomitrellae]|uniref:Glycosyltransferase n=1 Tax=Paenibacillus physcomitrellae TaxID=1619311 RepID=A0ABQ1FQ38_9BACL|nr:hypothetical protein [Paenibacillus physcomitrellae]GGA24641.1 hypothetical protein GCM10010917_06880 [Paenibacillus physcomitrellae]